MRITPSVFTWVTLRLPGITLASHTVLFNLAAYRGVLDNIVKASKYGGGVLQVQCSTPAHVEPFFYDFQTQY